MKKFIVYLLVIVLTVSLGFAVFFLVRDDEVISISASSMYVDKGQNFTIDITHNNKKSYTDVTISTSNEEVVSYDEKTNQFTAHNGGQARINFKTTNSKFRNLACDVIVGDGTIETPYYIDSAEELAAIGMGGQAIGENDVPVSGVTAGAEGYEEYWSNACYKLMADIDVSTINGGYWVPLKAFSGRFDGNGFTISKATINFDKYNELHKDAKFSSDNAGLFQEIKAGGLVYNLKLETFGAEGTFSRFGCIAGISYGVIERVEIKSADLRVKSSVFGGIAGVIESDDRGSGKTYDRDIARIESCSINFDLTFKPNTLDNRVGGLVGTNNGGTIVYSYANGLVNFVEKDNDLAYYNFGGLVGYNKSCEMTETNSEFTIKNQGAHIKDSYANITTKMVAPKSFYSNMGGVIGFNEEITIANQNVGAYGNGYTRLANIFSGVKYNSELLNSNEDGIEKNFGAIGSDAGFVESASTIYALNNNQMVEKKNYISSYKFERTYDDNGEFIEAENNGLVENLWDFSIIWSIDPNKSINSGRPYLNYSILEHLDDFANVGVPVIKDNVYRLVSDIQGTITIVGDSDISLRVDESKYLFLSPYELQHDCLVNWVSANSDIVRVEVDGPQVKITGLKPGNVSVMAQTNAGSKASINVRVVATQNDPLYTMMGEDLYMVENDVIKLSDHFQVFKNNVKQNIALSAFVQSTSNGGKIAIDGDKITAKSQGSVVISVKAGSYITKVYTVNILPDLSKVVVAKLDKTVVELDYEEGKQYDCIKVTDIFYSATGEKATGLKFNVVSENGEDFGGSDELMGTFVVWETTESPETYGYYQIAFNVKGVSEQTYRLEIADNTNNLSLQCSSFKIKVVDKSLQGDNYSEFKINKPENGFIVNVGETLKLTTNADKFVNAPAVTWEIHKGENNTYGSLTADGIFKGLSQGQTKVRAYINVNNKKYYEIITITIVPKQINVKLSVKIDNASPIEYVGSNIDVAQGQKIEITAKAYDLDGKEYTATDDNFKFEYVPVATSEVNNGVISGNNNETYSFNVGSNLGYTSIKVSIPKFNYSKYLSFTIREKAYLDGYIYNREQLENIRTNVNGTYTIASDIDLSDSPFTPIGTKEDPFTGTLKTLNDKRFVIKGLRVNSTNEYSGLFGYTQGATIKNITLVGSEGDVIEGKHYVGGLVGYAENTAITNCNIEKYTIKGVYVTDYSEDKGLRVGGMVGHATNGTYIYNCNVSALNLSLSADAEGYLGGLVGYLSTGARVNRAKSTENTVVATNSKETYVGGLVGFVRGSVTNAQIKSASIEGENVGGLAGEINVEEVVTLEFNVHNKGYRREDIKTFTKASLDVYCISVDNTTIKGNMAGGLFGIIRSGYISDVSIIATIEGVNRKSIKGGIASQILADENFTRFGGTGNAGIVECALVVATFKGAGDDYAISSSLVHNWNGKKDSQKGSGYVFNYVFDNDADGKAKYSFGSNDGVLNFGNWGDNVKAQKSSEELLKRETYTDKKFSTLVWNVEDGKLPTLKF